MARLIRGVTGFAALVGVALVAVVLGLGGGTAQAHSRLVGSDPTNGASLDHYPTQVRLTFNEDLVPGSVQLRLITQTPPCAQALGTAVVAGATVAAPLTGMRDGDYTVQWRVGSTDGHAISGAFRFSVVTGASGPACAAGSGSAPSATSTPDVASPSSNSTTPAPTSSVAPTSPGTSPAASSTGSATLDTSPVADTRPQPGPGSPLVAGGALAVTGGALAVWWWRRRRA